MTKYVRKPIVIEAELVSLLILAAATDWEMLPKWFRDAHEKGGITIDASGIWIDTHGNCMFARHDEMIIRGVDGKFSRCSMGTFESNYEPLKP